MEKRVTHLETSMQTLQTDVAVIRSNYATKADVAELRAETAMGFERIGSRIGALHADTAIRFGQVKAEMGELRAEIGGVRAEIDGLRKEVEGQIQMLLGILRSEIGELKGAIHRSEASMLRWVIGTMVLGQIVPALPLLLRAYKLLPP